MKANNICWSYRPLTCVTKNRTRKPLKNNNIQRIKILCLWINILYLKSQYSLYKLNELLSFMRIFVNIRA